MRWRDIIAYLMLCSAVPVARATAQASRGPTGTLIVSNMNDNTATIVDVASNHVLATLPTGEGPHEVAASHDGRWAVVSNYGVRGKPGNSITVIDVARLRVVRTIDLQEHRQPHGMAFLPGDTILAVTEQANKAVLLIDFRSGVVIRTLPTNGRVPHMLGLSASGDRIVTGNISDGNISVLSVSSTMEPRLIPVARQPEGIAIAPDGGTAWVGSNRDSVVLVVNINSGAVVDTLKGFGLPYRMVASANGKIVAVTDPMSATVRIFEAATHREKFKIDVPRDSVVATAEVPGSPSPEGIAMSADSRWAFVTLQGRNRVITVDLDRGAIVGWAPTGTWSDGIAYSALTHAVR